MSNHKYDSQDNSFAQYVTENTNGSYTVYGRFGSEVTTTYDRAFAARIARDQANAR